MKQTAVEWLENEFKEAHKMFGGIDTNWIKRFDQAKAMEKEQIEKAYIYGAAYGIDISNNLSPDIYYNETFKSE